ncbi:hypothetical protein [Burkholderia cenocepacia]|uniref:hypothetical protein n=1 Tax=Burkholderia cenocepacia TaxID=95486 RepID=UPI001F4BBCAC|nr:hypothetical protein [Burkholderia cenocepacia]
MSHLSGTRRKKNELVANIPSLDTWPLIDGGRGASEYKETIANRIRAIEMLVDGKTYREILRVTGQHRTTIRSLIGKCLEVAADGRIQGYRAVVPYVHLHSNVRQTPIGAKRPEQQGGMSCALNATLKRFPDLEGSLVAKLKRSRNVTRVGKRPTGMALVRLFHSELRSRKVDPDEWPFNSKYEGKRSIERYMRSLLRESFGDSVESEGNSDAIAHAETGKGYLPAIPCEEPFDVVEIDAYHVDAFLTVIFETPDLMTTEVVLERIWLLAAVDRLTTAVLAYSMVYSSEVTAEDVSALIRKTIVEIWRPKALTIPISYLPGSGLPSGVIPEAAHAVWTVTMLDGALANLAAKIHDVVRRSTGFIINWGPPGHFEHRPNVERTFKKIAQNVFQRFPSTTGSDPKHGRAKGAPEAAIKCSIRADEVEQIVDVNFAEHNLTPGERNYFRSPLETMRRYLCGDVPRCMVRRMPPDMFGRPLLAQRRELATVRGSVKSGRRPYVQLEHVLYTNPLLADSSEWLLGKQIVIYIDDSDLRQVWAYLPTGQELGVLVAQGKWGLTKHDLTTRRAIYRLIYKRVVVLSETNDPVIAYLDYLADLKRANDKRARPTPRNATEAARVANGAGVYPHLSNSGGPRPSSFRVEPINTPLRLSVLKPLPEGFFTVKNRIKR